MFKREVFVQNEGERMSNLYKTKKILYMWYVALLTMIVSCSLGLSLGEVKLSKGMKSANRIYQLVWKMKNSFNYDKTNDMLILFLIGICLFFLVRREYSKRCKRCSFIFSVCSATLLLIARAFYRNNDLHVITKTGFSMFKAGIVLVGYIIIIYFIMNAFIEYLLPKLEESEFINKYKPKRFQVTMRSCFIALIIAWLPYIIISYPCNFTSDARDQVAQFLGDEDKCVTRTYITYPEGATSLLNNHHPVPHTIIVGTFAKLGKVIDNMNIAMFLYAILQVIFLAFVYSYTVNYIKKIGVPIIFQLLTLGMFMFYPVVPMYAMTVTKDSIYSGFMILVTIQLFKIVVGEEDFFASRKEQIITFVSCLGLMLFRNNGLYILFVVIIVLAIRYRKNLGRLKRIGLSIGVPIILYWILFLKIILPALNIPQGSPREMLSVPFQHIGRYAVEWGEAGFEEGEIEKLDKILCFDGDLSVLQSRYAPVNADYIKNHFNKNYTKEELKDFIIIWFKLLLRHPGTCIEATLNNNTFYYGLDYGKRLVYDGAGVDAVRYGMHSPEGTSLVRKGMIQVLAMLDESSMFGWAFSVGTWNYMFIICMLYMIYKKCYRFFIITLPVVLNFIIACAGPIAQMRYTSQWLVVLPLFGAMVWLAVKEKEQIVVSTAE